MLCPFSVLVQQPGGVARNSRQGVRQSVAFLSVHSRSAALPAVRGVSLSQPIIIIIIQKTDAGLNGLYIRDINVLYDFINIL